MVATQQSQHSLRTVLYSVNGSDTTVPAHPAHSPISVNGSDTTVPAHPAHSPISVNGSDTTVPAHPAHSPISVSGSDTAVPPQPAHSPISVNGSNTSVPAQPAHSPISGNGSDTTVPAQSFQNNLSIYTQHKHTGPFVTANFLFGSVHDPKDKLVHLKSSSATLSRQASPLGMQFSRTSPISRITAQSPGQSIKVLSDKNREIKRLKSDLESEISENVRLQEQLKIEKDRNKELAHKLDGKTTEIKRLREDYLATEDFPSSDKGDAKVVEKRYKSEVKCLEEYVASLHVDIEKLQVEKEEVAIKVWKQMSHLEPGLDFKRDDPPVSNQMSLAAAVL
uniref:(California timema) hypothetical protein n=1 Tax=Timema californicum TaxID=61474 RepID=A0A7R9J3Y0_TIMCA|nr:unnamed protein product [Timema californicum]